MKNCLQTLLLVSIFCFPSSVLAQVPAQPGTARAQLEEFSDGSSGQVWLSRPGLFRWEYGGEFPELVVADGRNIWIYDEMLEQVTVKNQSEAAMDSPLSLLTDLGQLEQQFEVREVGISEDMQLLELRSRDAESQFERILLGLSGAMLRLMVMEDAFGLRTEVKFTDVQRNPEIESNLFTFQPPESADVIGEVQR
jgi:outer membrane lipoprotein carrier protein